jgi:hypothetical protein
MQADKKKKACIVATTVVILLAVIVICCVACAPTAGGHKPRSELYRPIILRAQHGPLGGTRFSVDRVGEIIPVHWDEEEGGFMINVRLGGSWVSLVVDTGSNHVSAKGSECSWVDCGDQDKECVVRPCPQNSFEPAGLRADQGTYEPLSPAVTVRDKDGVFREETSLHYGSQTSTVSYYQETITLPTLDAPLGPQQALSAGFSGGEVRLVTLGPMLIHRITRIEGSSTSNILGLAAGDVELPEASVLNILLPQTHTAPRSRVWSMFTDYGSSSEGGEGWISMGPQRCFGDPFFVDAVLPSEFLHFSTQFYVVGLLEVRVDGQTVLSGRQGRGRGRGRGRRGRVPQYMVLDTGTTACYGSTSFGRALDKAGWMEGVSLIEFVIGNEQSWTTLSYTPEQYRDRTGAFKSVINVSKRRTLDNFDVLFSNVEVFLMGISLMRGMYWEYDLSRKKIGVLRVQQ